MTHHWGGQSPPYGVRKSSMASANRLISLGAAFGSAHVELSSRSHASCSILSLLFAHLPEVITAAGSKLSDMDTTHGLTSVTVDSS